MSLLHNIKGLKVSDGGRESGRAAAPAEGIDSQEGGRVETMETSGLETSRQVNRQRSTSSYQYSPNSTAARARVMFYPPCLILRERSHGWDAWPAASADVEPLACR